MIDIDILLFKYSLDLLCFAEPCSEFKLFKGQMEVRTTHTYLVCYLILAALSPTSQV